MTVSAARAAISLDHDSPELARTYDETSDAQFNHGLGLIESLAIQSGEKVLDVGAGTGRLGAYVAGIVGPRGHVTGIDPLPLRIDIARTKGPANFSTAVGRAEDLSAFADASFDVVYLNSVFHWVIDKPKALAEIYRVLKPGGRLGLNTQDPNHPHQSRQFVHEAIRIAGIKRDPIGPYGEIGTTILDLHNLVLDAGFIDYRSELKTLVDHVRDVDHLIAWSSSSSFGNFLADLNPTDRATVRQSLARSIEPLRTPEGIRLERYLVFATARKP